MKRFAKIFANIFAILLIACASVSFTACEDIKTLEVTVAIYDASEQKMKDKTLTIDLYRHLAPTTVDAVIGYAKEGYYDNAVFYVNESHSEQIMIGDFRFENKELVQNLDKDGKLKSTIKGEFEAGGTTGSDLVNKEGSIGLWRSYIGTDFTKTDKSIKSGRSTWFMPTDDSSCTGYDGYFCVFAQFDIENNSDNKETWTAIKNLVSDSSNYFLEYSVYYTGSYDESAELNCGLTFNSMLKSEYEEKIKEEEFKNTVFEAEDGQLNCYNQAYIKVPMYNKDNKSTRAVASYIKSIKVK